MKFNILGDVPTDVESADADRIALVLRIGLSLVFIAGGWWKLSRAIDPERSEALVSRYMADNGYINAFFEQYLFADPGAWITPLGFLILLSAFELASGLLLLAGLIVRALSFVYAFLLWTFVIALPVVTAPGASIDGASHFSPALLVQIRDVGLSGMFFILLNLGSGAGSLDRIVMNSGAAPTDVNWNGYGLLLRLSVAAVFVVGGLFAGYDHIKTFVDAPLLLIAIGIVLASGHIVRPAALGAFAIIAWYCVGVMSPDNTAWGNFNAIKRELAYLAACVILIVYQGGRGFRLGDLIRSPKSSLFGEPTRI